MKKGLTELEKMLNIETPQLILLSGSQLIEELSGDIAKKICFKKQDNKDYNVLEIIKCQKEYVIQRMIINEANVPYRNWYCKEKYTDKELQKIGQAVINLVNAPKNTPTIIEQNIELYDLKKVSKLIKNYAHEYTDSTNSITVIVVDIFQINDTYRNIIYIKKRSLEKYLEYIKDRRKTLKLIKDLKKISHKLRCTIIFLYNIDFIKKHNKEKNTMNYLTKEHIDNIEKINKYVDKFIITNIDETKKEKYTNTYNVDVYNKTEKIGECKLEYDCNIRKFYDYK